MIIVPCHRVLDAGGHVDGISAHGGVISRRWLLSTEGTHDGIGGKTLFDALLPVAPLRPHG